jgi:hypothetical protein
MKLSLTYIIKYNLPRMKKLFSLFIFLFFIIQTGLSQINTLETINSFYGHWCCANGNYIYGTDVNNFKVVLRKAESGQSIETRGSVTSLDASFTIEHKIFATSTPGLIFVLVKNNSGYFLLKSRDGAATFTNVFAFGQGNGPGGTNNPEVRILRSFLELKRNVPAGGGAGTLYVGEYNISHSRISGSTNDRVRIMRSVDNGDTWTKVMEWNTNGSNQVGHIHAMKQDPYTGEIYICTGDGNNKAGIIKWDGSSPWTDNRTMSEIGRMNGFKVLTGAQRNRVCDVLFDGDYFYTFADTPRPDNPSGSESGIWRGSKDFTSYRRVDNQIHDYDPMHIGWYGEKIGNTFIFTTSREYDSGSNWSKLNTEVYCSTNGVNWYASGKIDWIDYGDPTVGRFIDNVFTFNDKLYIDCVEGAGHPSTIQCELNREWKTSEDPVILHPVYFVGSWNNSGNDANPGTNPDAPKRTLNSALTSNRISAGARVRVAAGNYSESSIYPSWSGAMFQGRGSVVIEGQGMSRTHIVRSSGSGNTYGIYLEAAKTLTDANTPLILKDLDIYLTVDGGATHSNYVLNNKDSFIKTIDCRIGNTSNDDSPLVNLSDENAKLVSENSLFIANSGTSIYKNIVRANAANTGCFLKNCIILNAYNAFDINFPGIDFSLKNCTLYGIENTGVLFGPAWNTVPVIKNCIFSCGEVPVKDLSGLTGTDIDYNLYNKPLSNIVDGGHSLDIGIDPLFVDAASWDFNLKSNSPCVMKGINLSDVAYDFAGNERKNPPCIGAYENTALSVTPSETTIPSSSGTTRVFNIISNTYWNVSYHDNWINLSSSSGNGSGTITATFAGNSSSSPRVGTITISGTGVGSQSVKITQDGIKALSVTPSDQDTGSEAGSTTFNISSNTSWTVSDDAPWLTVNPSSGNNDGTLTVSFTANTLTSPRTGTITISGTGVNSRSITITQDGVKVLTVTPSDYKTESDAGSTTLTISSNTSWTVSDDALWLTVNPASGNGDGTIIASFTANTSTSPRIGTITISGTKVSSQSVKVTQDGIKILTVTPYDQKTESDAGSVTFDISSNTSWTVSDDASWLSVNPVSGTGNGTITASIAENTSASPRLGTITISGTRVTSQSVTVRQNRSFPIPTLSMPANISTDIDINPALIWNIAPGAISYSVQVSKDPDFENKLIERQSIISSSFIASGLDNNTLYYWRVKATYPEGTSKWSEPWGFTTEISSDPEQSVSDLFIVLKQNYPNPFKNFTTIEFYISKPCLFELTVFNNLGEKVEITQNEYPDPGFNSFKWNPPSSFKSGIYYCQLRANNIQRTMKMIYINK